MTKLAKLLNITPSVRNRDFEFSGQKFKVRVPLAKEAEEMFNKASNPSEELVEAKYHELSKDLIARKDEILEQKADVKFLDNDVVLGETSLRKLAKTQAGNEVRVIESFKLLLSPTGESIGDITYEQIQEEFPLPVQLSLVKKIAEVISPSYEEVRKN